MRAHISTSALRIQASENQRQKQSGISPSELRDLEKRSGRKLLVTTLHFYIHSVSMSSTQGQIHASDKIQGCVGRANFQSNGTPSSPCRDDVPDKGGGSGFQSLCIAQRVGVVACWWPGLPVLLKLCARMRARMMLLYVFRRGTGTERLVLCWYTDRCWNRAFQRPLSSSTPLTTLPSRVVGAEIQRVFS